ncbi:hypothetical protein F4827_002988 [Paraburkholderia bannensis]|uniref:Uncharacterized protein n=1 Tax=Paraburkholderia bannensis TaxID=765414 RepID=A0A7W9TXC6_9BURK|nr:hypothetical protein [Paraburkholderia sp. WP4_3_2]MBB3258120.1 hypothetical protein [Paraburkholderia sp. WP4_3_2]MBB6103133.1 hypothetical protein [Paraburkholderia bannensis]
MGRRATLALQVFVPYHRYMRFLKWLTLSLLTYVAVQFTAHVPRRHCDAGYALDFAGIG